MIRPESLHRNSYLVDEVVRIANDWQIEIGEQHLLLYEFGSRLWWADIAVLQSLPILIDLEVL